MKLQSPPLFVNSGHLSEIRESAPLIPRHSQNILIYAMQAAGLSARQPASGVYIIVFLSLHALTALLLRNGRLLRLLEVVVVDCALCTLHRRVEITKPE